MNFCQFFNKTMKKISYSNQWRPTDFINIPLGILILIGTAIQYAITTPILFIVHKISAMHLSIPKIKISVHDICKPIIVIVAAGLLAIIYQNFWVSPPTPPVSVWITHTVGIFFLNLLYIGEVLFLTLCIKNYELSIRYLYVGLTPYILIGRIIQYGYNKTSSSCPLKRNRLLNINIC